VPEGRHEVRESRSMEGCGVNGKSWPIFSHLPTTLNRIAEGWRRLPKWDRWFSVPITFVFFALVGWVPNFYVWATEIPPFEQLQRSSGTIYFDEKRRSGYVTKLNTQKGVMAFACGISGLKTCVFAPYAHSLAEWQNRPATVWWFPRPNPYTEDKYAAQVEIDGVIVLSYQDSVRLLQGDKNFSGILTVIFFILPFFYWANQIRLNLKKEVTPHE